MTDMHIRYRWCRPT